MQEKAGKSEREIKKIIKAALDKVQKLHDTMGDAMRAFVGREKARRRIDADLAVFADLDNK